VNCTGRLFGLMLLTAMLATGCATEASNGSAERPGPAVGENTQVRPEALRFSATTVDGQDFSGESLAGKPAVLWFWAAWCAICQREAPGVADVAQEHADEVNFVGVAALSDLPDMREFVSRNELGEFTHLADTEGLVWQRFGVTAQPAYAFVGPDGSVDTVKGSLSEDELATRVQQLAGS
jgi:thiol-disulfide isomerase/thioredoxin